MAWVLNDTAWWNTFTNGDFELPITDTWGSTAFSVTNGGVSGGAHSGSASWESALSSGSHNVQSVSVGPFNRHQALIGWRVGKALVAGRRYDFNIWVRCLNGGASSVSDTIKMTAEFSSNSSPTTYSADIADVRVLLSAGAWVNITFSIIPSVSFGVGVAFFSVALKWNTASVAPIGGSGQPVEGMVFRFDTFDVNEFIDTPVDPIVLTYDKEDVTAPGGTDGEIDLHVAGGIGPFTYFWSDGLSSAQDRTGLPAGTYLVTVVDSTSSLSATATIVINETAVMTATPTVSHPTSDGASDGAINIVVAGGSGSRTYSWGDGPTTLNRSGLPEGTYTITITDTTTGQVIVLPIVLTDPGPPVIPGTFLDVPAMQSLHMVVQETIDSCTNPQNLDNRLFCQQVHPNYSRVGYAQKVAKCDSLQLQWNSDYENFVVALLDYGTNAMIKTFAWELKEENLGVTEEFPIRLQNHTTPGKTRVYFQAGAIPIPLAIGDNFEVLNNVDGYDGFYQITDIIQDTTVGYQYLVINKNWTGPGASSLADGSFYVSTADFNVFEASLPVIEVPDGMYYVRLQAINDNGTLTAVSEPIHLAVEHPETNLIEFRNFDNAFDVTWTTGIICRVRIESHFFKRVPGGERTTSRNSNYSLVKVSAKKARVTLLEVFQLPPYLHEKLSCIFDMDFFSVNGQEHQANEPYGEPEYLVRYPLANSSIKLEMVDWFDKYNSHDIGSIADDGFILTEGGFLKR